MALKVLALLVTCNLIYVSQCVEIGYDHCLWVGHSPFCFGSCPEGHKEISRASKEPGYTDVDGGFGRNCLTGTKKLCCKGSRRLANLPSLNPQDNYYEAKVTTFGEKPNIPLPAVPTGPLGNKVDKYDDLPSLGGQRPQVLPPYLPNTDDKLDKDLYNPPVPVQPIDDYRPVPVKPIDVYPLQVPVKPIDEYPALQVPGKPNDDYPQAPKKPIGDYRPVPVEPIDDYPTLVPQTKPMIPSHNDNQGGLYNTRPGNQPTYSDVVKTSYGAGYPAGGRQLRFPANIRRR